MIFALATTSEGTAPSQAKVALGFKRHVVDLATVILCVCAKNWVAWDRHKHVVAWVDETGWKH